MTRNLASKTHVVLGLVALIVAAPVGATLLHLLPDSPGIPSAHGHGRSRSGAPVTGTDSALSALFVGLGVFAAIGIACGGLFDPVPHWFEKWCWAVSYALLGSSVLGPEMKALPEAAHVIGILAFLVGTAVSELRNAVDLRAVIDWVRSLDLRRRLSTSHSEGDGQEDGE